MHLQVLHSLKSSRHVSLQAQNTLANATTPDVADPVTSRELWLFNTMSGKKTKFERRLGQGNKVNMYCCGVTVYDYSHVGESRGMQQSL